MFQFSRKNMFTESSYRRFSLRTILRDESKYIPSLKYKNLGYVRLTGTRSKIFNEIVLEDNHFLTLHEKCILNDHKKRHGLYYIKST